MSLTSIMDGATPMMLCNQEPDETRRGPEDARPANRHPSPGERPHAGRPRRGDGCLAESCRRYRVGSAKHGGVEFAPHRSRAEGVARATLCGLHASGGRKAKEVTIGGDVCTVRRA